MRSPVQTIRRGRGGCCCFESQRTVRAAEIGLGRVWMSVIWLRGYKLHSCSLWGTLDRSRKGRNGQKQGRGDGKKGEISKTHSKGGEPREKAR